jgi:hypothetical protein
VQDFDANASELKAEVAPFNLLHLMTNHPDFTLEKLDLEHLAEELAVVVFFSPNKYQYHCKIAGEGVEN